MSPFSQCYAVSSTFATKYGGVVTTRCVSPGDREYGELETRAAAVLEDRTDAKGYLPTSSAVYRHILRTIVPELVHEVDGVGVWLVPYTDRMKRHTRWWAEKMAYTITVLGERRSISGIGVCCGIHGGIVDGNLSFSELSDLSLGNFPSKLSSIGVPAPGFRKSAKGGKRRSPQSFRQPQQPKPKNSRGGHRESDEGDVDDDEEPARRTPKKVQAHRKTNANQRGQSEQRGQRRQKG